MKEVRLKSDYVKWFSELNKDSKPEAGGKGANLAEIYNLELPVPPGFVVTSKAYSYFISKIKDKIYKIINSINVNNTKELNEKSKQIREIIEGEEFQEDLEEDIIEAYESLNIDKQALENKASEGAMTILKMSDPVFVAVRSSATAEDLAEASFAGQQDTFLNVKGKTNLLENIRKCFSSLFTPRAIFYREKQGFKDALIAVVVQRMIDSEKSGVMFSKNPVNIKENEVLIEAVFGLGEGIVSGKIKPDGYIVSDKEIKKINISDKKIALIRSSSGETKEVELSKEKSNSQVLSEYEIKKLAEISLELEEHYNKPQDIEFAIEAGKIYIVQTRPITTLNKKIETREIKGKEILTGLAASPGVGEGKVKLVLSLDDLEKVEKGDVLVTKMTNPDMVVTMQKASAIVTDEGGVTAHAAIVSREMGIPCIVGTGKATSLLKNGQEVTVDGSNGKVYSGGLEEQKEEIKEKLEEIDEKEEIREIVETKTKIKIIVDLPQYAERASKTKIKEVGLTRIEGIIAMSGKHPLYYSKQNKIKDYEDLVFSGLEKISEYFNSMWIRTSDIRSDEYSNLEGSEKINEDNPMLGDHGIRWSLRNKPVLIAELKAMSRVAEKGKKIGMLLPQIISVEEIKQVKEILKEENITNLEIGVMVETPAAIQIINDLIPEIKFISFGTNDLTQYTLAVDRNNEQVSDLFKETHPAVLNSIAYAIRRCKKAGVKTSICGQAGSDKEMVKFLVENHIDSISVNADKAREISEYVRGLEGSSETGVNEEAGNEDKQEKIEKDEKEFINEKIEEGEKEGEAREETYDNKEEFPSFEVGFDVFGNKTSNEEDKEEIKVDETEQAEERLDEVTENEIKEEEQAVAGDAEVQEEAQEEENEINENAEWDPEREYIEKEHQKYVEFDEEEEEEDEDIPPPIEVEIRGDEEEFQGDNLDIF